MAFTQQQWCHSYLTPDLARLSSEVHPDLESSVVPPSTRVALIGKELTEGAVFLSGPDYYQLCFSVRGCCL